ncbi:MAG: TolC family protein, partial [Massilia sp.]
DPVLKAGIDNLPVSGADRYNIGSDFMTMRRIGVVQEITRSDKLRLRAAQFERGADKARAEKAVMVARIERDTALAWLDLFYADKALALVQDLRGQAALSVQAADAAYRGGKGSQAELLGARAALASGDDKVAEFVQRRLAAQAMLERWTGPGALSALANPPPADTVRLDAANLEATLVHHPDVAVLERQREVASVQADLAKANQQSDWSVEVALQHRGHAYSNMLSVGLSVPLQWDRAKRQDRELGAQLALVEQAKGERDELLRAHVAETRVLLDEWHSGRDRLTRYREQLLPLADERGAAALAAYRGGKASLTEVLAARSAAFDVRLQALQLEQATARLWAQLNFLTPSEGGMAMAAGKTGGAQ